MKKKKLLTASGFCFYPTESFFAKKKQLLRRTLMAFLILAAIQVPRHAVAQGNMKETKPAYSMDATVSGVDFYHAVTICNGKKVVLLKFDNKNNYEVKVSWKEVFATQMENRLEGPLGQKELTLAKGITLPNGCADVLNSKSVVSGNDLNPTYVAEIQNFKYENINVTKLK